MIEMKDDLGKRMKEQYEMRTRTWLPRRTYTIIRLDGKAFHTFTRRMKRPYDQTFMDMMDKTAISLCSEIQGCKMAYVQSDEISLLLTDFEKITTDAWFDGQVQKIVSVSASIATAHFNVLNSLYQIQVEKKDWSDIKLAMFDSRVFCIPDPIEVENYFIWRQKDAVRNSISMHAQSLYSHKELHGKSQSDMHDMIHAKDQNWDNLPDGFKRGRTFVKVRLMDIETMCPDGKHRVFNHGTDWVVKYPDFLKEREDLSNWIPKINESLTE